MSKLTLYADERTIRVAKEYAAQNKTSVSALFGRFVHGLEEQAKEDSDAKSLSTLAELTGVISIPDDVSYDQLRKDAVLQRYKV